jgi:hypothetical protein
MIRRAEHATALYPQKLAQTSQTSGGSSDGVIRWRTKAMELFLVITILDVIHRQWTMSKIVIIMECNLI